MAFIDELEKFFYDNSSGIENPNIQALLQAANETKNLTHSHILEEENEMFGKIILLVAYGILITISVFGNTLVCHVVLRNGRMHTVTNFFITNLAISDLLLTLINVPFNIARNLLDEWPFGSVMCHLLNFSLMVSVYVSTFTLMGIALDRHQVLLYPLNPRMSKPIGLVVLGFIWSVAICLSLPFGIYNKVQTVDFVLKKARRCTSAFPSPSEKWEQYLTGVTLILQYVIPLSVIAFTYGRIVRKLWVRSHVGAVTHNQQMSQQKAKRKSIKMLIVVVVVFALCWMPLNVYQILADFHPNVEVFHYNSTAFFICHWIAISSTCYNPFVYCWLNETFRSEVKSRFKCCLRPKRVHPGTEIDGILMRSDRAYRRRQSKSMISSTSTVKAAVQNGKGLEKYRVEMDIPLTRDLAEHLAEVSPCSETSLSFTTISGTSNTLEKVPEFAEVDKLLPQNRATVRSSESNKSELTTETIIASDYV